MKEEFNPLKIKGNSDLAWKMLRTLLVREVKYMCERCNKSIEDGFEIHHKDGCGLNNIKDNLQVLCPHCHRLITMENGQGKRVKELALDWDIPLPSLSKEYIRDTYEYCFPRA